MSVRERQHRLGRQRVTGSGYVEALIVICLFAGVLAWALSVGRTYVTELKALQQGRGQAWEQGSQVCPDVISGAAEMLAMDTQEPRGKALLHAAVPSDAIDTLLTTLRPPPHARRLPVAPSFSCNELPRAHEDDATRARRWMSKVLDQVLP